MKEELKNEKNDKIKLNKENLFLKEKNFDLENRITELEKAQRSPGNISSSSIKLLEALNNVDNIEQIPDQFGTWDNVKKF